MASEQFVGEDVVRALVYEMMRMTQRPMMTSPEMVLDISAFKILWLVVEVGEQTQRQIADALRLEQSTINRQVTAAVKNGLVERIADNTGGSSLVRPTPEGEAAYLHDGRVRAANLMKAMDELGVDRVRGLVSELRALNDAVVRARSTGADNGTNQGTDYGVGLVD